MSLRIFILATVFTSGAKASDWKIDFSRRYNPDQKVEIHVPPHPVKAPISLTETPVLFVKDVLLENDSAPEIVILNTERGFVPSTVSLEEGKAYRFHIVNVNEEQKNISFVMEAFSQHHGTYYGKIQTFTVRPEKSGIFRFSSPETAALGKMVVSPSPTQAAPSPSVRLPAAE